MNDQPRRDHTSAFKAKLAVAAIKREMTLAQLTEYFEIQHKQIKACCRRAWSSRPIPKR